MPAKILIVEKHGPIRQALRDWIKVEFPASSLCEAVCGEDAITLLQRETPDLIIMDLQLPRMNGIETARKIRASDQAMKILILGTHEDPIYRDAAAQAGVNAYVPKHKIFAKLIPAMHELLDNGNH